MKNSLSDNITSFAKSLGFDLVGFTKAKIEKKYFDAYKNWLKKDLNADMEYMEKISQRKTSEKILPGAKSVIVLAMNYYHSQKPLKKSISPDDGPFGIIARYAYGRDYHKIIKKKLKELEKFIKEEGEKTLQKTIETKSYIDTGPILERAFAEQSGIGKVGKNSCLITKEFGSWVFLAAIVTNIDLKITSKSVDEDPSTPSQVSTSRSGFSSLSFSLCGSCTRCIDSCPTKAIISPGVIDARKCISYLTIENKGKVPEKFAKIIKKEKRLYGCDICQEVCPHNCRAKETSHKELLNPKIAGDTLNLKKILSIKTDEEFLQIFAGSPLMRAKRKGLQKIASL